MEIHRELTPVGVKTAVALGYFDGVHRGHAEILRQTVDLAARLSLRPTVFTFYFDGARPGEKGSRDLFPREEKFRLFEESGIRLSVEVPFQQIRNMQGSDFISKVLGHGCLNAAVVSCGEDFRYGRGRGGDVAAMRRLADPLGIRTNVVPFMIDGGVISTTRIKRLIAAGDIPAAVRLLGRPYRITLPTVKKEIGVGVNFTTASQETGRSFEMPKPGVYLSRASAGGSFSDAVTYIGTRPSKRSGGKDGDDESGGGKNGGGIFLDTHILDAREPLADGIEMTVELLRILRPETVFPTQNALKDAIFSDIERARTLVFDG